MKNQQTDLMGQNNIPDVLDEAKWGLDWLLKMHPKDDWLFNQLGDDRDHRGMRIPKKTAIFMDVVWKDRFISVMASHR
jgi:hypothetical protein